MRRLRCLRRKSGRARRSPNPVLARPAKKRVALFCRCRTSRTPSSTTSFPGSNTYGCSSHRFGLRRGAANPKCGPHQDLLRGSASDAELIYEHVRCAATNVMNREIKRCQRRNRQFRLSDGDAKDRAVLRDPPVEVVDPANRADRQGVCTAMKAVSCGCCVRSCTVAQYARSTSSSHSR